MVKVFRPLLKINAEFSAEEFETALLNPNDTLSDIHIPLLKVATLAFPCCLIDAFPSLVGLLWCLSVSHY